MTTRKADDDTTPVMMAGNSAGPATAPDRDATADIAENAMCATPDTIKPGRGGKTKRTGVTADAARQDIAPQSDPHEAASGPTPADASAPKPTASKLDRLLALLRQPGGATIADLVAATGWQAHSVRGAMAGALRKKGHAIQSEKPADGPRRYRTLEPS
jgi:hypothetical protein